MAGIVEHIGNIRLLEKSKVAFLCSRKIPASIVLKCYDWAIAQRDAGNCVISGFHSQLEQDVFHYLLKGTQPIILVQARGLPKRIDPSISEGIESGRILMLSPFADNVIRITSATAKVRNEVIINLADEIVGYASPNGSLDKLLTEKRKTIKLIQ